MVLQMRMISVYGADVDGCLGMRFMATVMVMVGTW